MPDLKKEDKGYLSKLLLSLRNLLSARELLSLRNIRADHLHYFFAFPIAMTFVNVQDFFLHSGTGLFGMTYTTVTFMAFVLGAIVMFSISNKENISAISKLSASITIAGFIPWLFLPGGNASLICSLVFMAGVGGCVSSSSFSYVFMLNNAERFFGSALMILLIQSIDLCDKFLSISLVTRNIIALGMIGGLCACILLSRKRDYAGAGDNVGRKFDPSIWLALYIFLSYFAIRITGFYSPAFAPPQGAQLWGFLSLVLILFCISLQAIFKRSVWTLCNIFFLTSIIAYVMWYAELPEAAYLLSELKELGFLISLYLVGCVTNKFCDFRMHKRLILLSMAACGVLYMGVDVLHMMMPTQTIAVITAAILFAMFLLLSPAFSQFLFFADWSKEFRMTHMSSPAVAALSSGESKRKARSSLDDTNLSPREKQVVILLLRGMTLRQAAPELGLTFSTISTYSKSIYKKLGINSRSELFILFGYSPQREEQDLGAEK